MSEAITPTQAILELLRSASSVIEISDHGGDIVLTLVDGATLRSIRLQVLEHDLVPAAPKAATPRPEIPVDLTPEEADRRGLPRYLSRDWLVDQLYTHGSPEKVAAEHDMQPADVRWAATAMHIDNPLTERIRSLWDSGAFKNQNDLAKHLGVARTTISKAVGNGRDQETIAVVRELIEGGLDTAQVIAELGRRGDRRNESKIRHLIGRARMP